MATAVVPLINQAGLVMISPTVASTNLQGQDDNFFRVNCTTREAAIQHARVLYQRGVRRPALAYDASNLPFSGAWTDAFTEEFSRQGGAISAAFGFPSASSTRFSFGHQRNRCAQAGCPDFRGQHARYAARLAQ